MSKYASIEAARKELGDELVLRWINQRVENNEYRKTYNATKNEVNRQVRNDPRFKALLNAAKAKAKAKSA